MKQTAKILIVGLLVICTALTFMSYTASASNTEISNEGNFVTSIGYETYKGALINYYQVSEGDSVVTTLTPTTYTTEYWALQDSEFIINFEHAQPKKYTIGGDEYSFIWVYEPNLETNEEERYMVENFYTEMGDTFVYQSTTNFIYGKLLVYKNQMPYTAITTYLNTNHNSSIMTIYDCLSKYQFVSYKDVNGDISISLVPLATTYMRECDEQFYYLYRYKGYYVTESVNPCNIQYTFAELGIKEQTKGGKTMFTLIFTSDEIYKSGDNVSGGGSTGAEISLARKMTCVYDDFNRVNYSHFSVDTTGMHIIKCTCRYCGYTWYCSLTANQWNELLEKTATSEEELSDEKPYFMVGGASIGDGSVSGGFNDIINGTEDVQGVIGKIAYVFQMIYCMLPSDVVTIIDWGVGMLVVVGIAKAIFG